MKKIYNYIGSLLLFAVAACSTDNALEEPVIGPLDGSLPEGAVIANPYWSWVALYPGFVSASEPMVEGEVSVEDVVGVWQSSGYYVVPGDTVCVTLPAGVGNLKCRIGGFSDVLTATTLSRYADMDIRFDLHAGENKIMSYFGGHLYFYYEDAAQKTSVKVSNVAVSPDFVLGETDAETWKNRVAASLVPWGELRSEHVILTLALEQLKKISDPEAFLRFYDEMIELDFNQFFGVAQSRALRLRTDVQLTAGSFSADFGGEYPVVMKASADSALIVLPQLDSESDVMPCQALTLGYGESVAARCFAVPFSRLNYFRMMDRFQKSSDYTVAWKSLVGSHVNGNDQAKSYYDLPVADRIGIFIQLAQQYGWNMYPYIIQQMKAGEPALDEQDKADALAMYATEYAGENLQPFFEAWGFTLSPYAIGYMKQFTDIVTPFWTVNHEKFGDVADHRTPVTKTKGPRPVYTKADRTGWTGEAKILVGTWKDNVHKEGSTIGPVNLMFDGNASTLWHSLWSGEGVYFPHTITIDMKNANTFNYIYYRQRATNNHNNKCRRFQLFYKDENGEWIGVDDSKIFTLAKTYDQEQYVYFSKEYTATELKLVLLSPHPSGTDPYSDAEGQLIASSIAEFGVGLFK
ncbi:MAG: M60 family metallopeptidase [Odoribacter sp.]|nr:M60 family metallopeptidase [Odoribacter sp.]